MPPELIDPRHDNKPIETNIANWIHSGLYLTSPAGFLQYYYRALCQIAYHFNRQVPDKHRLQIDFNKLAECMSIEDSDGNIRHAEPWEFHPGSQTVSTEFGCARADCPRLWDEHKVKREASIPHCVYLNKQRQNTANAAASKKANPKKRKAQTSPGNSAPAPNAKKSKTALTADNSSNTNALSARKRKHRDESDESDDEVDELQDDTEGELDEDSSYRKRMRLDVAAPLHACSKGVQRGSAVCIIAHIPFKTAVICIRDYQMPSPPDPSRSQSRSALYDWPRENEELYRDVEFTFGSPIIEETSMQEHGDGEQQNEESQGSQAPYV
ncbi:hypothetical protein L227DRAFT_568781 [Lentinus tigrinus ALCF2SS1-6]|uniref:Uncharacterized protein n=1 Tax=Lentinus tigrinus ALCF2SS1-6 TaxID=1328759 RepID=A0A5C2RKL6_9APHY|nr:hypothetical protein L227DRAFT_568781 [Lentinus tigrinus ALCF2SS1-6]